MHDKLDSCKNEMFEKSGEVTETIQKLLSEKSKSEGFKVGFENY